MHEVCDAHSLLEVIVAIVLLEREKIATAWREIYPSDPMRRTALHLCYVENHQFIRLNAVLRQDCYNRWLPILSQVRRMDFWPMT